MNNQSPLKSDPLEILLLNRILYKLNNIEEEQELTKVLVELKALQEIGILSDLREVHKRRFDEVDGALACIQGELWRNKDNNRTSQKEIKGMMETIFDAYFEVDTEDHNFLSPFLKGFLFFLGGLLGVFLLYLYRF